MIKITINMIIKRAIKAAIKIIDLSSKTGIDHLASTIEM
jgi:hypothetical protein